MKPRSENPARLNGAQASCLRCASILLALLFSSTGGVAQHSKTTGDGPLGGKIEITVPRSMTPAPSRTRGSKPVDLKQLFVLATRTEDGEWYYSAASITHEMNVTKFLLVFFPIDLAEERRFYKEKFWDEDRVKADLYLHYTLSIYSVDLLCASGQYRFETVALDLAGSTPIGAQIVPKDWLEWRDTLATPWEAVRGKVCR